MFIVFVACFREQFYPTSFANVAHANGEHVASFGEGNHGGLLKGTFVLLPWNYVVAA